MLLDSITEAYMVYIATPLQGPACNLAHSVFSSTYVNKYHIAC